MDISKYLSKAIGIYLLLVSSAMLINMEQFLIQVNALVHDAPLMFVTGFFTLILGVVMVTCHNVWEWNWRVLITVLSWLSLLKGLSLIVCPQFIDKTSLLFVQNLTVAYTVAGFDFVLGLVLIYFGFKKIRLYG